MQTLQFLALYKLKSEFKTDISEQLQRGTWTPWSAYERPYMRCTHHYASDKIIPSADYSSHISYPATSYLLLTYPHPMHIEAVGETGKLTKMPAIS